MVRTVKIIREIIESLSFTIKVNSIDTLGGGQYKINTCNTYHLTNGLTLSLGGNDYKVIEISVNSYILIEEILSGTGVPVITEINIDAPKFEHGKAIDVNAEVISRTDSDTSVFPLGYLYEPFDENDTGGVVSAVDKEASVRIFFLAQTNWSVWNTDEHFESVIYAMENLAKEFVSAASNNKNIGIIENKRMYPHRDFGVRKNRETGEGENMFDIWCSGIELNIDLPILKEMDCSSNC